MNEPEFTYWFLKYNSQTFFEVEIIMKRLPEKLNTPLSENFINVELKKLNDFESLTELNSFINALEDSFIIDENLTLSSAINTLWNFRNIDFSNINRVAIPTSPYELEDGRQILIISENFSTYAKRIGLINS